MISSTVNNAALSLYRRLLRYGQQLQFTDQTYFNRRIRSEFRRNRIETDPAAILFCLKVRGCDTFSYRSLYM